MTMTESYPSRQIVHCLAVTLSSRSSWPEKIFHAQPAASGLPRLHSISLPEAFPKLWSSIRTPLRSHLSARDWQIGESEMELQMFELCREITAGEDELRAGFGRRLVRAHGVLHVLLGIAGDHHLLQLGNVDGHQHEEEPLRDAEALVELNSM